MLENLLSRRVLENEALAISVTVSQRGKENASSAPAGQPTPRLEILNPNGQISSQDFLRAGKFIQSYIRQAHMLDLAFLLHLRQFTHRVFKRHFRVC